MKQPQNHSRQHYFDELVKTKCGADLLALGFFPNAKEVTESFAAYSAVRRFLWQDFRPNDPNVTLIAVGDGTWPRTAATFAFRSAWNCISVDPGLHPDAATKNRAKMNVTRLTCEPKRVEDITIEAAALVVVCVHSHAPMPEVLKHLTSRTNRRAVVAIPCCVMQEIPGVPLVEYRDTGILSPCNLVKVWRDVP